MIFLLRLHSLLLTTRMPDNEKWTLSTDTYSLSSREPRFKRVVPHIASRLVSKSKFLGKSWSRCSRSPLIYHRGLRVDSHRAFRRQFTDGQGNFFAVATARVCHREKCRLFFSDCDKRAPPQGYTWVDTGTRVNVSISWSTNDCCPTSCTVTLQHAATVGQPVDKLMSKVNWRDVARTERTSRVAEAEAHPRIFDNDSMQDLIYSKLARKSFSIVVKKSITPSSFPFAFHLSGFLGTLTVGILIRRFIRKISLCLRLVWLSRIN